MTKLIYKDKSAQGLYKQIKIDLISCVYQPGERIVIDQLAERLRVSSTPVREILNRLAAEELVSIVPQMGFFMPMLTETDLRNLYSMQQIFLNWAVQRISQICSEDGLRRFSRLPFDISNLQDDQPLSSEQLAKLIGDFFLHLIQMGDNHEVTHKTNNLNDRLYQVRARENEVTDNFKEDLMALCAVYMQNDFLQLQKLMDGYFASRIALVPALISTY
jgi:DNA-binding GntR family transcriptional regulator